MSRIWVCVPSIRPHGGTLQKWKDAGYCVAVVRQGEPLPYADLEILTDHYLGWAKSINMLAKQVLAQDERCMWICAGGDDTLPDPHHSPDVIAEQCTAYFKGTFGVLQPTGDDWNDGVSRIIERFAGSPWMGREWCERAYRGNGPLYDGFLHCWSDEELMKVAKRLGVFWQRRDLTHLHQHWGRGAEKKPAWWDGIAGKDYTDSMAKFRERERLGFPGSEPLAA